MAKVTIRRLGILSMAKMQGLVGAVVGLIIGILYGIFFMIFGAIMATSGAQGSGFGAAGGVIVGLVIMIGMPVFYGALAFVGGAIVAAVYNFAAGYIGGLEMELNGISDGAFGAPPPPPQNWASNPYQQAAGD